MKIRTLATTVRCDARDAAMAHHLLMSQGNKPNSVSDLFRECVALVAALAIHKELIEPIDDTIEAVKYLQLHGVIDCLEGFRPNRNALLKVLVDGDKHVDVDSIIKSHSSQIASSGPSIEEIQRTIAERMERDREEAKALRGFTPKEIIDE